MPPKATSTGLAELTMTISIPRTAILSVLPTNLLNFKLIFLQAIMRAFMSGWTDPHHTLSEFNSGTYTGVSLYGLTLWCKYLPEDSIMAQHGPIMVKYTWLVTRRSLWIYFPKHLTDTPSSIHAGKLSLSFGTQV